MTEDGRLRCAFTKLGVEIEKPHYPKRLGYMKPWDYERGSIKHVNVLWDNTKDWKLYNAMYIRRA